MESESREKGGKEKRQKYVRWMVQKTDYKECEEYNIYMNKQNI